MPEAAVSSAAARSAVSRSISTTRQPSEARPPRMAPAAPMIVTTHPRASHQAMPPAMMTAIDMTTAPHIHSPMSSTVAARTRRDTPSLGHTRATTLEAVTERAPLSRKLSAIAESATLKVDAKAKALQAAGRPVITLCRGRTRLRHAAVHRGCRRRGAARPGELPLHPRRRAAGAARGDRREDAARLGARGRRIADRRHERRQAGRLPGVPGGREPGRRGAAARAVLDDLPRGDRARRRRARRGLRRRRPGLQGHRRAARGRPHRAHDGAGVRVAVEPDRVGVHGRGDQGDRRVGRRARHLGHLRRDLPEPRLRRRARRRRSSRRCRMPRPRRSSSTASRRPTR